MKMQQPKGKSIQLAKVAGRAEIVEEWEREWERVWKASSMAWLWRQGRRMSINEMDRQNAEHFFPGERPKLLPRDARLKKYTTAEL